MQIAYMLICMISSRHNLLPHKTYFFTAALCDRRSTLLTAHIALLREAVRYTKMRHPFIIEAIVVLPDHLHTIWTLPPEDTVHPHRWRTLQSRFARSLRLIGVKLPLLPDGGFSLWQPYYSAHAIHDKSDLTEHIDRIHLNPVKHGLVEHAKDWPYSSFHRHVQNGRQRHGYARTLPNEQEIASPLF